MLVAIVKTFGLKGKVYTRKNQTVTTLHACGNVHYLILILYACHEGHYKLQCICNKDKLHQTFKAKSYIVEACSSCSFRTTIRMFSCQIQVLVLLLALSVFVVGASANCGSCKSNAYNCINETIRIVAEDDSANCTSPYTQSGRGIVCSWKDVNLSINKCDAERNKFEVIFSQSFYDNRENDLIIRSYSTYLVMRGELTMNTVIRCKTSFLIKFTTVREVLIHNLHFQSCENITMHLKKKGEIIMITNSSFTGSCIHFLLHSNRGSTYNFTVINTSFCNCHCENSSVLFLSGIPRLPNFSATLINVTVRDNFSPLFSSMDFGMDIKLKGSNYFDRNRGAFIIAMSKSSSLSFIQTNVIFAQTSLEQAVESSPVYAENSKIIFKDSIVKFIENKGSYCGGIRAKDTQLLFKDNVTIYFTNNNGIDGGALSLHALSKLLFNASQDNITIDFKNNTAQTGGAIYVHDRGYDEVRSVFDVTNSDKELIKLRFSGNDAIYGGNDIYGGWIDFITEEQNNISGILHFDGDSSVASYPIRICLCDEIDQPNCSITEPSMTIHGCVLSFVIVAVGQRLTPVESHVEAAFTKSDNSTDILRRSVQDRCTRVNYTIEKEGDLLLKLRPYLAFARPPNGTIIISDFQYLFENLTIHLKKKKCMLEYVNANSSCGCGCPPESKLFEMDCNVSPNGCPFFTRNHQQWVGFVPPNANTDENGAVISHKYCPHDYCKSGTITSLSPCLEDSDFQDKLCASNRAGILCGSCKTNYSRVLGSTKCKMCSNDKLLIIVPSVLLAGLGLVLLLIVLDLTVSVGTINGLIFYANIIKAQHTTFFTTNTTFLGTFIAWLNLDLGIETCLFDGLDSYTETWLQFCFPLYIWVIVVTIIIASHYSTRVSKLCGKNIVQVLATLFLLSYAKLLRLIIDVVMFAKIDYPKGREKWVWHYDGNIEYMRGKHIPLFLVTLLLQLILIVFYPFSLVSIQCLLKISHYRVMFWVNKLKPLFDAYTGPYKARHRYWTGLLLLIRLALLVVFALNQSSQPTNNTAAITYVSVAILTYFAATKGIYKSNLPNYLEAFFVCNLGLTAAAVQHEQANNNELNQTPINISAGLTFIVFVGILLYHTLRQILRFPFGEHLHQKIVNMVCLKRASTTDDSEITDQEASMSEFQSVTSTVVELKEPLIDTSQ